MNKKIAAGSLALLLLALLMNIVLTSTQFIKGDGYEYLLMTESLKNHGSAEASLEDLSSLYQKIQVRSEFSPIDQPIFNGYKEMLETQGKTSMGYFKAKNDKYYSYHFWLYSLVNVPALFLADLFKLPPVRSFLITNIIIFIFTFCFLLNTRLLSQRERWFIAAFYLFSGTTYYMDWSHPEVFSASTFLVGLVFLRGNKLIPAALWMALAAQQNPPIGLIAFAILAWQSLLTLKAVYFSPARIRVFLRGFLPLAGIAAILIGSPLFYYLKFGTPSLIVSVGAASNQLISAERLFSLFFDVNQGMIVAIPMVFLLFVLAGLSFILKPKPVNRELGLAALMLGITLVVALPSLATGNWNSGQSIFLRYAYWISMPFGVAVMLLMNRYQARSFYLLFTAFLLGQCYLLLSHRISGREDTMENKRLAAYLLNKQPDWYNPIPAILVKRNIPGSAPEDAGAVYYFIPKGGQSVNKILYHSQNEAVKLPFCNNKSIEQIKFEVKPIASEGNWFYLNPPADLCKTSLPPGLHKFQPSREEVV